MGSHKSESLTDQWLRGGKITAGRELAREASAARPNYRFGQYCARKCGTYLRAETPQKLGKALHAHENNKKKCINHPDNHADPKGTKGRRYPRGQHP